MEGDTVLGVGRIVGPYQFVETVQGKHQRPVEWLDIEPWQLPVNENAASNWRPLRDFRNWLGAESRILGRSPVLVQPAADAPRRIPELKGIAAKIQALLQRKGQLILYGPPGTGKTYQALQAAREIAARAQFQRSFADLSPEEQQRLTDGPTAPITLVTFHPGYGYEDFIEGYRPQTIDGTVNFQLRDGLFKQLVKRATQTPNQPHFLVIDEINRGDIPRIFGELLTLLEYDKRGEAVILPLSGERFAIPANLYVLATMNTADRSIALLDAALRRRFGFLELMPDYALLEQQVIDGIPLGLWLQRLNQRLVETIGRDARNLQIGHAYLMSKGKAVATFAGFTHILQEDIIPLLEEYAYEDYGALEQILGSNFIDSRQQVVRHELFEANRRAELRQAILALTPDLITTNQATAADEEDEAAFTDEDEDEPANTNGLG